jgi:hypothetical protein
MILIHGTYHWARRRKAYRGDFCLSCQSFVVAEQYRMFDVGHLFWIPLLPLGFRRRWHCTTCGKDPHARLDSGRWAYVLGTLVTIIFAALAWAMPMSPQDVGVTWGMRILIPALAVFFGYRSITYQPPVKLRDALAVVPPFPDDLCLYCRTPLQGGATKYCRACDVERVPSSSR